MPIVDTEDEREVVSCLSIAHEMIAGVPCIVARPSGSASAPGALVVLDGTRVLRRVDRLVAEGKLDPACLPLMVGIDPDPADRARSAGSGSMPTISGRHAGSSLPSATRRSTRRSTRVPSRTTSAPGAEALPLGRATIQGTPAIISCAIERHETTSRSSSVSTIGISISAPFQVNQSASLL